MPVVAGLVLLYADERLVLDQQGPVADQLRVAVLGLPAALVLGGLLLLERAGIVVRGRFPIALGAASYALYLLHPLVLSFAIPLPAGPIALRGAVFAVLVAATVAISLLFHAHVEAPLTRTLRRRLRA
jgi:peptidoglycan/LPS O-acetylase OafA/YrhL